MLLESLLPVFELPALLLPDDLLVLLLLSVLLSVDAPAFDDPADLPVLAAVCLLVVLFVDGLAALDDDFWLEAPVLVDEDLADDDFFGAAVFCVPVLAADFFVVLLPVVFALLAAVLLPDDLDLPGVRLAGVFLAAVLVLALPDCLLEELVDLLAELFDLVVLVSLADEADLLAPLLADALLDAALWVFVLLVLLRFLAVLVVAAPDWLAPPVLLPDVGALLLAAAGAPGTASAALAAVSRASFFKSSAERSVACSAWST